MDRPSPFVSGVYECVPPKEETVHERTIPVVESDDILPTDNNSLMVTQIRDALTISRDIFAHFITADGTLSFQASLNLLDLDFVRAESL